MPIRNSDSNIYGAPLVLLNAYGANLQFASTEEKKPIGKTIQYMSHIFLPIYKRNFRIPCGESVTSNSGSSWGQPHKVLAFASLKGMETKPVEAYPTRSWSCSSLMRGASFLRDQQSLNKSLSYEEIVGVTRMHSYTNRIS